MSKALPTSLSLLLREATREEHRALEASPLLDALAKGAIELPEYIAVLNAFRQVYLTLEPSLVDAVPPSMKCGGYRYQPRLPLLEQDLRDLGVEPDAPQPQSIDPGFYLDGGALLGTLYVLEGATQGGRVIAPTLSSALALRSDRGARYFHLFRYRHWFTFRALLEQADVRDSHERDRAIAAASSTFGLFLGSMDAVSQSPHPAPPSARRRGAP